MIYSTDQGVGVIDLAGVYPNLNFETLEVVNQPTAGTITRNGKYLVYVPTASSVDDEFVVKMSGSERTGLLTGQIVASNSETGGCGKEPVTFVQIKSGTTLTLDLLDNKDFCGYDRNPAGHTGTCIVSASGSNLATDISIYGADKQYAVFTYTSNKDFTGSYSIEYVVATQVKTTQGTAFCDDASQSGYYSKHTLVIQVVK